MGRRKEERGEWAWAVAWTVAWAAVGGGEAVPKREREGGGGGGAGGRDWLGG